MADFSFNNESSQATRRRVLENDRLVREADERRRSTYSGHALDDEPELGGRFKKVNTTTVTGIGPGPVYPRIPSGPWAKNEMPDEPLIDGTGEGDRLGYRIDGGPEPVAASTVAASAVEGGPSAVMSSPPRSGRGFRRRA